MTISSESRLAGPFAGNGITDTFPFTFKVFTVDDVLVTQANAADVESVLAIGVNYSVSLNADQESAPGGTIVLTAPLPDEYKLSITSNVKLLQPVDLTNNGGFYPDVINRGLDRATIQIQQIAEKVSRAATVPVTSGQTGETFIQTVTESVAVATNAAAEAQASAAIALASANDAAQLIISPRAFGAVGDGVTDDSVALSDAIIYGRTNSVVIDGGGLTYKVNSQIVEKPWRVSNMVIDASDQSSSAAWTTIGGEFEVSNPITNNVTQGLRQLNVTSHGYSVGDAILATSNLVIETLTSSRAAHWSDVASATTNTITCNHATGCNILLADTPIVRRLPKAECRLTNVKFIGGATCKAGFVATRFTKVELIGCSAFDTLDRGFGLAQCFDYYVSLVEANNCSTDGLGYGISISGCGPGRVDIVRGWRCRHVATYGASGTIPCTGGSIGEVQGFNCLGAALDTHPGVFGFTQTGWTQADMATLAGEDGVTWQAIGGSFRARLSGSMLRHAAVIQPYHVSAAFGITPVFSAEVICAGGAGDRGVYAELTGSGDINYIELNFIGRSTNECVSILGGAQSIEQITYSGSGYSTAGRAVRTLCAATTDVRFITQSGHWVGSLLETTYHLMGTGAVRTALISVPSGSAQGGTYGLRVGNKANAIVGAVFLSGSTAASLANPAPATITTLT